MYDVISLHYYSLYIYIYIYIIYEDVDQSRKKISQLSIERQGDFPPKNLIAKSKYILYG